ncbi:MAG TPA: M1 family metallopeptidase [Actinomycetota bacterium]|nr:M1 family metallopeptidase [Actinomycetota bacterium]
MSDEAEFRLPRNVVPSRYDITIETDLDAGRFRGDEAVTVTVVEPTSTIVLNAKDLEVSDARVVSATGSSVDVAAVELDEERERATLALAEPLPPGEWVVHLAFAAPLNERLVGYYRSTFKDDDGAEHTIATSHFEATDARRAFPCWDEPDLKAVYGMTLVVPAGTTALSNGPETSRETLDDGRVRVRFADTMKMSTYLVAFVVGPLMLTDPLDVDGVPTRIASRPGKQHLAGFALDAGAFALRFFSRYYAIPYPDAKVDHIALPDFAQGAMENLGCITYRETLLLIDPDAATQEELVDVAETVAHELAHMWFGDLVTMRWWNGIWLNEAFATFMSYLTVDAYRPDWKVWETFARTRANALEIDSLSTTRAIEFPVHSPDDASGMFDTLTYTKGGAVLRMLEQWLGPDRFRDGIRRYLRTHAYGNTETHDLWDALEAETGEPVRRVADAWIFQPGYPAITASLEGDQIRLTQRRMLPSDPSDPTRWPVPLLVRQVWDDGEKVEAVLVEADGSSLPLAASDAVVVANAGGASFVRVFYDEDLRGRLVTSLDRLTPSERQSLVDDTWAAVTAGHVDVTSFLDLVEGFADEDELTVWQAIVAGLSWCDRFVEGDARERFRDFVRDLVRPAFERLGWEPAAGESDLTKALRGHLVAALGILGNDPETQAMAREIEGEARAGTPVDAQLAATAVDVVAASGTAEDYERFRHQVEAATTPQQEQRYLFALPRFKDAEVFRRTLDATLDDIRPQDGPFVLARSVVQRDHGAEAWRFIREHWEALQDRFSPPNVIALAAGTRFLTEPPLVDDVQSFFTEHDIPQSRLVLQQTLERQRIAAALHERAAPLLRERFGG